MRVIPKRASDMIRRDLYLIFLRRNRRVKRIAWLQLQEDIVALGVGNTGGALRRNVQAVKMQVGRVPLMMTVDDMWPGRILAKPVVERDKQRIAGLGPQDRTDELMVVSPQLHLI